MCGVLRDFDIMIDARVALENSGCKGTLRMSVTLDEFLGLI